MIIIYEKRRSTSWNIHIRTDTHTLELCTVNCYFSLVPMGWVGCTDTGKNKKATFFKSLVPRRKGISLRSGFKAKC
jgi:hypothetical protein